MNQTTRLPSRNTALQNQMRRNIDAQRSLRAARSIGVFTSQTVDGVFRRPKAKASSSQSTSIVPRWG
ncbi:MAG: hypothetical protein E6Q97_12845 [Desulfurellales bacterium]|nr:MAG: hypothetical protein E6Q97_29135 [Desulfurellales bacterium]TXH53600.1 MAG: hypothetical protein E6Q97_12845 [Desulfurellales bacterium]